MAPSIICCWPYIYLVNPKVSYLFHIVYNSTNIVYVRIMKLVKLIRGVEEKEICVLILPGPPRAMTN